MQFLSWKLNLLITISEVDTILRKSPLLLFLSKGRGAVQSIHDVLIYCNSNNNDIPDGDTLQFLSHMMERKGYFFFCAFSAALVTLPADRSLGFTDLMTPTATVCLISRTAKRPRGGKSVKVSTHMGFDGTRSTMAASPDLMALGLSVLLVRVGRRIGREKRNLYWLSGIKISVG